MQSPKHILDLNLEERKKFIQSFDTVLSDCDGVLWRGKKPIKNVGDGINSLIAANKKLGYISNNSGRSDDEYKDLFNMCNIKFDLDQLCHTVKNIVTYLKNIKFDGNIYVIGSDSLHRELKDSGFRVIEEPNYAENETFSGLLQYISVKEKVSAVILHGYWNITAPNLLRAQMYLAKNPKCLLITGASVSFIKCQGLKVLGPGTFSKLLSDATGRKPIELSKPGIDLGDIVIQKFQIDEPQRCIMIGDMLEQDIGFGKLCGFQTMAVLTGGLSLDDFVKPEFKHLQPDFYANSVADFVNFFKGFECTQESIDK